MERYRVHRINNILELTFAFDETNLNPHQVKVDNNKTVNVQQTVSFFYCESLIISYP